MPFTGLEGLWTESRSTLDAPGPNTLDGLWDNGSIKDKVPPLLTMSPAKHQKQLHSLKVTREKENPEPTQRLKGFKSQYYHSDELQLSHPHHQKDSTQCQNQNYPNEHQIVLLLHFMMCHSQIAIGPAPRAVVKTTRWNNIRDAFGMQPTVITSNTCMPKLHKVQQTRKTTQKPCCSNGGKGLPPYLL